jgi:phosphatidylglycerophosphatase A
LNLQQLYSNPVHALAFGFGSGLASRAPGTCGTLAAIPIFLLICQLPALYYLLFVLVAVLLGIYLCGKTAQDLRVHDHSGIVWDEMAGYWLTMLMIPVSWHSLLAGFLLFRLFDIWKPFPIRWLDQHVSGGFGIMADDVLAGFFAWLCLSLWYVFPPLW